MERNWLIRTTENQILGPITKLKLLEFLQKGALDLNDQVTSGNGYWFSLKEKDLVEKYLYGDIPQSYNPVSEAKSVLRQREDPDRTSSLNASPPNKTQVLKSETLESNILPESSDLEFPEVVSTSKPDKVVGLNEEIKLPNNDDLELPDPVSIMANIKDFPIQIKEEKKEIQNTQTIAISKSFGSIKITEKISEGVQNNLEEIIYPKNDDLDFPDPEAILVNSQQLLKDEGWDFLIGAVEPNKNMPPDDQMNDSQLDSDSDLTILYKPKPKPEPEPEIEIEPEIETGPKSKTNQIKQGIPIISKLGKNPEPITKSRLTLDEPNKMHLHERKVKTIKSSKETAKGSFKDKDKELNRPALPDNLIKRNDNYLLYILIILILIILGLFFYYYRTILNKPLPV